MRHLTTKRFRKSEFVQAVMRDESVVIWHSLFGHPLVVSAETFEFLGLFTSPRTLDSIKEEYELDEEASKVISDLRERFFLVPEDLDERTLLESEMRKRAVSIVGGSRINYLSLIMAEVCNFRCVYCIHFNNLQNSNRLAKPQKLMGFGVAKMAIDGYLAILRRNSNKVAVVNFGGGEPLLGWPTIREILEYCANIRGNEFEFRFSLNTNASLITREVARVLKRFNVSVATSLDGTRDGNDLVRLTQSGEGTFDRIVKGFDNLELEGYPTSGIAVTVNERNFSHLDERVIDWAIARGMSEVRIDIDVLGMVEIPVQEIVNKLTRLRRYASEKGIKIAGFWSRPVENLNTPTIESDVAFCGAARGNSLCVNPSGVIYPCGYSKAGIGTLSLIQDLCSPESDYCRFVLEHQTGKIKGCQGCAIEGQCSGGCQISREFGGVESGQNNSRLCEFYRAMTKVLLAEMAE